MFSGLRRGVTFIKRADFLTTRARVTCDTRDPKQQRDDRKATLLNMIQTAVRTPALPLGIGGDRIRALTEKNADRMDPAWPPRPDAFIPYGLEVAPR